MSVYKIMKVFDCQWDPGMPRDVKSAFFENCDNVGNDVYVEWMIEDVDVIAEDATSPYTINQRIVDDWLLKNGGTSGETVLIKHWW